MASKSFRLLLIVLFSTASLPPPVLSWANCCSPKCAGAREASTDHNCDSDCCCGHTGVLDQEACDDSPRAPTPKPAPMPCSCTKWCCVGYVPLTMAAAIPLISQTPEPVLLSLAEIPTDGFRPRIEHPPRVGASPI